MYKDHRKKMVEVKQKERQSVYENRYRTSKREIQKLKEILEEVSNCIEMEWRGYRSWEPANTIYHKVVP